MKANIQKDQTHVASLEARSMLRQDSLFAQVTDVNRHPTLFKTMQTLNKGMSTLGRTNTGGTMIKGGKYSDAMECGLCYQTFKNSDQVYNCQNMHVFHTNCYEDSLMDEDDIKQMLKSCPTCGSQMNIVADNEN